MSKVSRFCCLLERGSAREATLVNKASFHSPELACRTTENTCSPQGTSCSPGCWRRKEPLSALE